MAAVLSLEASPWQLGWLSVLGVLPGALVAWWAGAWIDRRSRRTVMIAADRVRALLIMTIPAAAWLNVLSLPHLYAIAACVCVASVLFDIADHAFLPVLIPAYRLVGANSKRETIDSIAEITGPSLGGLLVQWLTAPVALAVDALSFVASTLLIGRIRKQEPAPAARALVSAAPSLLREARDGATLVLRDPLLRALFASTMLMTMSTSFMAPLYTLFALDTLRMSPGMLGLVIGAGGVGALAGAASTPAIVARFGAIATARLALLAGGFAQMFIPLAPADPLLGPAFLIASQLLGDGLLMIYMVTEVSLRQRSVPLAMLGRAAALWKMAYSVLAPIGMLTGALLAERFGVRNAMWCIVAGVVMAGIPLLIPKVVRFSTP